MRCLLDKVTARYMLQGFLRLAENRNPGIEEIFARTFSQELIRKRFACLLHRQPSIFCKNWLRCPNIQNLFICFWNRSKLPCRPAISNDGHVVSVNSDLPGKIRRFLLRPVSAQTKKVPYSVCDLLPLLISQ